MIPLPGNGYPEIRGSALLITSTGDTVHLDMDPREYINFRVSPDGTRLAAVSRHGEESKIWVHDLDTGVSSRMNTGSFANWPLAWSPSQWLAFSSDRDGAIANMYKVRVDGSGEPVRFAQSDEDQVVSSWSSQGVIVWLGAEGSDPWDIWVLPPDGDPAPFFTSGAEERYPTFPPTVSGSSSLLLLVSRDPCVRAAALLQQPSRQTLALGTTGSATRSDFLFGPTVVGCTRSYHAKVGWDREQTSARSLQVLWGIS